MAFNVLLYNVKYLFATASLIYALNSYGQKERWDTFLGMYGKKPGTVYVDMGLASAAPDKNMPYLVITGPHAHSCDERGIPDTAEMDKLGEILDDATNYLGSVTAKRHAGTFAYDCEWLNYYYVRDTAGVRTALARMYGKSYSDYDYSVKIKHDPAWMTYRTFLFPDEKTQRWKANAKVISAMIDMGDDLAVKRDINFKFHFQTEQERTQFAAAARGHDFKADKFFLTSDGLVYGLTVSKFENVRIGLVDSMTTELTTVGKKFNAIYIGWDAPATVGKK